MTQSKLAHRQVRWTNVWASFHHTLPG